MPTDEQEKDLAEKDLEKEINYGPMLRYCPSCKYDNGGYVSGCARCHRSFCD